MPYKYVIKPTSRDKNLLSENKHQAHSIKHSPFHKTHVLAFVYNPGCQHSQHLPFPNPFFTLKDVKAWTTKRIFYQTLQRLFKQNKWKIRINRRKMYMKPTKKQRCNRQRCRKISIALANHRTR